MVVNNFLDTLKKRQIFATNFVLFKFSQLLSPPSLPPLPSAPPFPPPLPVKYFAFIANFSPIKKKFR